MAENDNDARRNSGKCPVSDELTEESHQRVHDIVAQVDEEMDRRARRATHDRFWGWYPMTIREWIDGLRVPPP